MSELIGNASALLGILLTVLLFIAALVAVGLIAYGLFFKKRK